MAAPDKARYKILLDSLLQLIPNERIRSRVFLFLWVSKRAPIWLSDPVLRNYRNRLRSLQGKYKGNRCIIMGNGPSLNITPLERLENEYVWGVNRCYLLFERIKWRPTFYVAVDTRVVPDNAPEIINLFSELQQTKFFFPYYFRLKKILPSAPNTYWYKEELLDDKDLPKGLFSTDPVSFVRSVYTVTVAALQLAVFLGFNPIYFIGCDVNYTIPASARFEDPDRHLIVGGANDDPNHFSSEYFGTGKKYHQPYPERMIFNYQQAKLVCDRLNVQVFNATIGGKLEVFPRVEFDAVF